jgi:predicted metal-binding protein
MTSLADKPEIVRRISAHIDPELLREDLEWLSDKALALGAEDAAIIQKEDIVFNPDIRRRVKKNKSHPSLHWPLDYPRDNLEEAVRAYQWAIFFRMKIDDNFPNYGGGPIQNETHRQIYLRLYEITTSLESSGFYMGYHLSLGLASGNCRSVFCADEKRCWPMIKGRTCTHPYRGRPSMEAAGIDAVSIAGKLNWLLPEDAACPLLAGLVLIS